jgi:hypothetical protein
MTNSQDKDVANSLEVVSGNPTEQELAAVVAVLREAVSTNKSEQAEPNWAKGGQLLRGSTDSGALEWRSDFKGEI